MILIRFPFNMDVKTCKGVMTKMRKQKERNALSAAISYFRQKKNLSLEQVCEGLCSVATLTRIEQGERSADSLLGTLLLERIGKEAEQFELLQNDEDYALWKKRGDIQDLMQQKQYQKVYQELAFYREMKQMTPDLHEQFCLYQEVLIGLALLSEQEKTDNKKEVCENILIKVLKALRLTKPAFGKDGAPPKQLYTQTEIELTQILTHYSTPEFYKSQNIGGNIGFAEEKRAELLRILEYIEYFYTERRKEEIGVSITIELAELERSFGNYAKAIEYLEKGISFVSQGRGIKSLEKLHFLKAQALFTQLGAEHANTEKRKEIQRECLMAYCTCEVCGLTESAKKIEVFCREKMEWQITELEM